MRDERKGRGPDLGKEKESGKETGFEKEKDPGKEGGHRGGKEKRKRGLSQLGLTLLFTILVFLIMTLTFLLCLFGLNLLIRLEIIRGEDFRAFPFTAFLLACLLLGTVLAALFSRMTFSPLQKIMDAVDAVAQGDYSVRVVPSGLRVFQELGERFNHMAQELGSVEMLRSDFVNNFSHEFKTPIVSIRGFAKALQWEGLGPSERQTYLSIIIEEAERLSGLSQSILNLSRIEGQAILTDRKRLHVSEQIRQAIAILAPRGEGRGIAFAFDCPQELYAEGSEELLRQVWINILDNAIKFSEEGGSIEISGRKLPGGIKLCFQDEGCGMGEEARRHIFDRFYQEDKSRQVAGNGLGMSLVKRIVDLHEGEVSIESEKGKGTCVQVFLPARGRG